MKGLRESRDGLQRQAAACERELAELSSQRDSQCAELQSRLQMGRAEGDALALDNAGAAETLRVLQAESQALEERLGSMRESVGQQEARVGHLQVEVLEGERLAEQLAQEQKAAKEQVEALEGERESLQKALESCREELKALQDQQLQSEEQGSREVAALESQAAAARNEVAELQNGKADLQREVCRLEKQRESANAALTSCVRDLEQLQGRCTEAERQLQVSSRQQEALADSNQAAVEELKAVKDRVAAETAEQLGLIDAATAAHAEGLKAARDTISAEQARLVQLQAQVTTDWFALLCSSKPIDASLSSIT